MQPYKTIQQLTMLLICMTAANSVSAYGGNYGRYHHGGHHYSYGHHGYHYKTRGYHHGYRGYSYRPSGYSYSYAGPSYCRYPDYRSTYKDSRADLEYTDNEKFEKYRAHTVDSAWTALVNGQHGKAINSFGALAAASPDQGMHKIGYSLAAASAGNHDRAIWAMRRAFQIDPYGITDIADNANLTYKVMELIDHYKSGADDSPDSDYNRYFMLSALYFLTDDLVAARTSIEKASGLGDDTASAKNLFRIL